MSKDQQTSSGDIGKIGEGDTSLVLDILPEDLCAIAFENLRKEVQWHTMLHRGM